MQQCRACNGDDGLEGLDRRLKTGEEEEVSFQ